MVWSNTLCGRKGRKKAAPVNMIGAVSPAVRETSRMTPVRMPLAELGRTTRRMVCQRVAPSAPAGLAERARHRLQRLAGGDDHHRQRHHGEREARGEDAGAEAEEQHEGADAEQRVHDRGHAGEVDDGEVDEARQPVVAARTRTGRARRRRRSAPRRSAPPPPARSCPPAPGRCRPRSCRRAAR